MQRDNRTDNPTLTEMTEVAIRMLANEPNGYFLLVEGGCEHHTYKLSVGGRIDHAMHSAKAKLGLEETRQMHHAVARARQLVNLDDTLIVVTADHSHVLALIGYPYRNESITGHITPGHICNT
jgi:alkaline phosphatase